MVIGVDMGRGFLRAAILVGKEPRRLTLANGEPLEWPMVAQASQGRLRLGPEVECPGLADPSLLRRDCWSHLGSAGPLRVGESEFQPESLVAGLLVQLLKITAQRDGVERTPAVGLTVPAIFDEHRREALREAARQAGLERTEWIETPCAAALAFAARECRSLRDMRPLLVLDCGSGAAHGALLRFCDSGPEQLAPPLEEPRCGGVELDLALLRRLVQLEPGLKEWVGDPQHGARRRQGLAIACRSARSASGDMPIEPINCDGWPSPLHVSRDQIDETLRPFLEQIAELGPRLLREAGVAAKDIEGVLLVGGNARLTGLSAWTGRRLGCPVWIAEDPCWTAAQGAALFAAGREAARRVPPPLSRPRSERRAAPPATPDASRTPSIPVVDGAQNASAPPVRRPARPLPLTLEERLALLLYAGRSGLPRIANPSAPAWRVAIRALRLAQWFLEGTMRIDGQLRLAVVADSRHIVAGLSELRSGAWSLDEALLDRTPLAQLHAGREALVRRGVMSASTRTQLWVFEQPVFPTRSPGLRRRLRREIAECQAGSAEPAQSTNQETPLLLAVLHAAGLCRKLTGLQPTTAPAHSPWLRALLSRIPSAVAALRSPTLSGVAAPRPIA